MTSVLVIELTPALSVAISSPRPCPLGFTNAEGHYQWGCSHSPKILSIALVNRAHVGGQASLCT